VRTHDLRIELLSLWQAGSSLGRGAEADATAIVDDNGLPFLPGRTVKGLLREAVLTCEELGRLPEGTTCRLFGKAPAEGEPSDSRPGILRFDNARICGHARSRLLLKDIEKNEARNDLRPALFEKVSSTSIDEHGQARERTLRTVEVALPVTLHAKIHGPADSEWVDAIRFASPLVKTLGSYRHRGFGRCRVSLSDEIKPVQGPSSSGRGQQRWYRIDLLSDVIVTADAATEGGHDCLNYLPGSLLAGVFAGSLKPFPAQEYLSGKMLFGDALPLVDGEIAYPVPLSLHKPKGAGNELTPFNGLGSDLEEEGKARRPVEQLRNVFMSAGGRIVSPRTHYRMKTAIDCDKGGRAADNQLFGYQSIASGQSFAAPVWCEDESAADRIEGILTSGYVRLGRSRSAEYGSVRITRMTQPPGAVPESHRDGSMTVFLVSDLALERNGRPVLAPQGDDIGLPGASLDLSRTFLRTRSYTPWNAYHNTRMTERQVICHGSVLTFTGVTSEKLEEWKEAFSRGLGSYRQEGLGSILIDPAFVLDPPALSEGSIDKCPDPESSSASEMDGENAGLIPLLEHRRETSLLQADAIRIGRRWADEWYKMLKKLEKDGQPFPGKAQWASLRGKAGVADKQENLKKDISDFCSKGTRKHWWNAVASKREPRTILEAVLNKLTSGEHDGNDRLGCLAMYNACVEVSRALSRGDRATTGKEAHK